MISGKQSCEFVFFDTIYYQARPGILLEVRGSQFAVHGLDMHVRES
jgi:hypothetical protein